MSKKNEKNSRENQKWEIQLSLFSQYLVQLINEECQRIGKATDDAMDKFEERTNYFLSVTVGLKQEFVEQLIGYDLEDIAELTKDDLVNDFNIDKPSLAKLSRCIKKLKI